jgi:hypothetical protein|tara:strand:+ start:665 stop:928 length:264 start_codon:yes stop_codon:yes gene_type:complete
MDKKLLYNVVHQIISETDIDYDKEEVNVPFHPFKLFTAPFTLHVFIFIIITSFSDHCKEVYGLNEEESEYVWKKYKEIIKDKINNGL